MKKFSISALAALCLLLGAGYYYSYQYHMERVLQEEERTPEPVELDLGVDVDSKDVKNASGEGSDETDSSDGYYISIKNGYVIVYNADKSTIYEYTDIIYDGLPEELKEEIAEGKYIESTEELYGFLENYSS